MYLALQEMQLLHKSQPLQVIASLVAGPKAPEKVLQALDSVQQDDLQVTNSAAASKLHSALEEVGWLLQITVRQEHLLLRLILAVVMALAMRRLLHVARALSQQGSAHRQGQQQQQDSSSSSSSNSSSIRAAVPIVRYKDVRTLKPLGEGSYGTVYAAYWNCQPLILKKPKVGTLQQVLKEAEMMEHSRHSHVVQLLGVCDYPPALLMQWCQGGSLAAPVPAFRQAADAATVCQLLRDVAAAVCCFHSEASRSPQRALVHLDLRTSNVLLGNRVGPHWEAKLTDFVLAEWLGPTGTAVVGCTTNHLWVAPEVLQPFADLRKDLGATLSPITVSRASEVWMFGMLMLEVLTGQLPYAEQLRRLPASAQKAMMGVWSPCHEFGRPQLPQSLQYELLAQQCAQLQALRVELYDACTALRPEQRPSMHEVHARLESVCAQQAACSAVDQPVGGHEVSEHEVSMQSSSKPLLSGVLSPSQPDVHQQLQLPQQVLGTLPEYLGFGQSLNHCQWVSTALRASAATVASVGPGGVSSGGSGSAAASGGRRRSIGTVQSCMLVGSTDLSPFAQVAAQASLA